VVFLWGWGRGGHQFFDIASLSINWIGAFKSFHSYRQLTINYPKTETYAKNVKKISIKKKEILGKIGDQKKGEICVIKYLEK
jgi:hypothetical protein